jgi:hypothetical protein
MSKTEAWAQYRRAQPEEFTRDMDAQDAFAAGWEAASGQSRGKPWHESLAAVLIAGLVLAAICYVLAGTPH